MENVRPGSAKERRRALIAMLLFMLLCYVLIHDLLGGTLFAHCPWDSYTLQSLAWLEGRMDLDRDYSYLELAIYNGKYYVSFPPVPSVVMLPFAVVFGEQTPNNLIIMLVTMLCAAAAFSIASYSGFNAKNSAAGAFHHIWQQRNVDEHLRRGMVHGADARHAVPSACNNIGI